MFKNYVYWIIYNKNVKVKLLKKKTVPVIYLQFFKCYNLILYKQAWS